jgi:hypothetical protein
VRREDDGEICLQGPTKMRYEVEESLSFNMYDEDLQREGVSSQTGAYKRNTKGSGSEVRAGAMYTSRRV